MSLLDLDPRFDDLIRELRAAKPVPPTLLVQRIAALSSAPVRTRSLRRRPLLGLAIAATLVAAAAGAALLTGHDSSPRDVAAGTTTHAQVAAHAQQKTFVRPFAATAPTDSAGATRAATLPAAPYRATEEHASFTLSVADSASLERATKNAMRIVRSLGGFVVTANTTQPSAGQSESSIEAKVPIGHAQEAIAKLGSLGRILAQHVDLRDLQAPLNAQHTRAASLAASIATLRNDLATQVLTQAARDRIEAELSVDQSRLAAARRSAAALAKRGRLATISLELTTRRNAQPVPPPHHGAAHRTLAHAWNLLGRELALVGAALLLLTPLALVLAAAIATRRVVRRREEARLLAAR